MNASEIKMKEQITDMMIASTSHDMKTPLNSILSMTSLIQDSAKNEKVIKWAKITHNSAQQLLNLV